ncbi:MAG: hypothetical protein J3R72DRAFT_435558 [Linnemannia gamsii]|nr:MAG: hypothetical protein J3R72DRAFT_435558 [Linnemannia gamsii]
MLSLISNSQNNNIADSLPTEVILEVAPYLDRSSLFKVLRVCRRWSEILGRLAWSSISKTDWHLPYFPIQQKDETLDCFDNSLLSPFLQYVQTLEWHNNLSLVPTGIDPLPQTQLQTTSLARILLMTPNLTTLALRMVDDHPDLSLFESICNLKHLKQLDINLPSQPSQVPLKVLFPLFARLEELNLDGSWHMGDEIEKTNAMAPEEQQDWKIKQLTIDSINAAPLLQYCSALEELRMFHPRNRTIAQEHAASGAIAWKLRKPSNLKILDIYCARRASSYSFKVHGENEKDTFKPHLLLCWEPQEWWSTQDIATLF